MLAALSVIIINESQISVSEEVGRGALGTVYHAMLKGSNVAAAKVRALCNTLLVSPFAVTNFVV